ncbi:hypothetical protein [Ktedonobacter sp. SOSP1-52]|uniref:hypothetical protein n=1 Tax=Ktedonobacter sp. SOSP1-52 TaxID=2778366 RepID=UPI00191546A8|nr:hypothetical protein [Ktedonobacter sp. SOSP1-52]
MSERLQTPLLSLRLGGKVGLDKDIGRYYLLSTALTPLSLVNSRVLEQRAGLAPAGRNVNAYRYRSPIALMILSIKFALAESAQDSECA